MGLGWALEGFKGFIKDRATSELPSFRALTESVQMHGCKANAVSFNHEKGFMASLRLQKVGVASVLAMSIEDAGVLAHRVHVFCVLFGMKSITIMGIPAQCCWARSELTGKHRHSTDNPTKPSACTECAI